MLKLYQLVNITLAFHWRRSRALMSSSSGLRGRCEVCGHQNNEHSTAPCPAPRCPNRWKRCQVAGGCFRKSNNWTYRMCYACKDHPGAKDRLGFGSPRQRDVNQHQKQDYRRTGDAGGDTSGGERSSSSAVASSSPARGVA